MAQNPELLNEVSQQVRNNRDKQRAQEMAQFMHLEAILLLTENGQRISKFPKLVRPFMAAIFTPLAAILRINPFEIADRKTIEQTVVSNTGNSGKVKLSADCAIPKRSWEITFSIEGLQDELVLRSGKSVVRHHYNFVGRSGYLQHDSYYNELDLRTASSFRDVLSLLRSETSSTNHS